MLAHLLILAALTGWSQGFDVESPAFWTVGYSIPDAYSVTRIVIGESQIAAATGRIAPCEWEKTSSPPVVAYAHCRASPESTERSLKGLRRLALIRDTSTYSAAPAYPELFFKRNALRRESAVLEISSGTVPGIWGLLEAQTTTLNRLIAAHDKARRPLLEVVVVSSTETATLESGLKAADAMRMSVHEREHPTKPHWIDQWARTIHSVCEQLPVVFASCEKRDPATVKSIQKALSRLGEPFEEPGCRRFSDSLLALSAEPPEKIVTKLIAIECMTSARISVRMRYYQDLADDERFDALSSELSSQAALLEKVPTIRAFVRGELERVRANAARLRLARGKHLIVVKVVGASIHAK